MVVQHSEINTESASCNQGSTCRCLVGYQLNISCFLMLYIAKMALNIWRHRYQTKLDAKSITCPNTGCKIWQAATVASRGGGVHYGLVRVKMPGQIGRSKLVYVHRLQYMLTSGNLDLPPHLHVSHLCHRSLCVNFTHLSLEPAHINCHRQTCRNLVPLRCRGHGPYPDCILL